MTSVSPLVVALAIVTLVACVGVIIALLRDRRTYAGYREIAGAARHIAHKVLRGEVFRDGEDLVAAGNLTNLPVSVRFSYQENTPGLNIRMEVPSTFTLQVAPQGARQVEGKALVRTSDSQFDTRFVTRSDHPTQAKMLLSSRAVTADLQKLCCSTRTFISVMPGAMELSELVIPEPYTEKHVVDHLQAMGRLARQIAEMPGAEAVKIRPIQRERMLLGRAAMVIGVIGAVATVVAAVRAHNQPPALMVNEPQTAGVPPVDAAAIPGVQNWRLATEGDFDAATVNWLRGTGQRASGRIEGDFSGTGVGRDVAYVFTREGSGFRVVLLLAGQRIYDVEYDSLAVAGRVARSALPSITWNGPAPEDPAGDGLLLLLRSSKADQPPSAVVIFARGERVISAAPADYQSMSLE